MVGPLSIKNQKSDWLSPAKIFLTIQSFGDIGRCLTVWLENSGLRVYSTVFLLLFYPFIKCKYASLIFIKYSVFLDMRINKYESANEKSTKSDQKILWVELNLKSKFQAGFEPGT